MKHRHGRKRLAGLGLMAGLVIGAALLAGVGMSAPVATKAKADTNISVRMDFFLNEAHSGFFAAQERGYYAKEGLNVDIRPGAGSVSTVQQVAAGNDNFGMASAVAMTQQVARGADAVMIASPRQVFDGGILYWPSSGISKPTDLEGKTVALTASGFVALLLPTWAAKVGLDLKKVNTRVLDSAAGNALFGAQRVDALEGTRAQQLFYAPVNGVKPKILLYSDAGLNALGQGIIAKPSWAKANPGVTTKFLRATLKGWQWACDNPRAGGHALSHQVHDDEHVRAQPRHVEAHLHLRSHARIQGQAARLDGAEGLGHDGDDAAGQPAARHSGRRPGRVEALLELLRQLDQQEVSSRTRSTTVAARNRPGRYRRL